MKMPRPRHRRLPPADRRRRWSERVPHGAMAASLLIGLLGLAWRFGGLDNPAALVRLPNLLAWTFGSLLCLWALPPAVGWPKARAATMAYLLALPLPLDAIVGGRWGALLCLIAVGATLAAMRGKLLLSGVLLGAGSLLVPQILPLALLVLVYGFRSQGWRGATPFALIGLAAALGLGAALPPRLISLPVRAPLASVSACNGWHLLGHVADRGWGDYHLVGQWLFGAYALFLLVILWRRHTRYVLALTASLLFFAQFMLPTRAYVSDLLPAVALLAIVAPLVVAAKYAYVYRALRHGRRSACSRSQIFVQNILSMRPYRAFSVGERGAASRKPGTDLLRQAAGLARRAPCRRPDRLPHPSRRRIIRHFFRF